MYNSSSATVITPPRRQHKLTASAAADAEKSIAFRFSTSAQGTAKQKAIYFRSSFTVADTALEERAADDDVGSGPRFQKPFFSLSNIFRGSMQLCSPSANKDEKTWEKKSFSSSKTHSRRSEG